MKFNKWTVGLAAVGVVSLASAARADETTNEPVANRALKHNLERLRGHGRHVESWTEPKRRQNSRIYPACRREF